MFRLLQSALVLLLLGGCSTCPFCKKRQQPSPTSPGVQITRLPDRLRIEVNGGLFCEYFFQDVPRPYFYPVIGPEDTPMTRNWPMKTTPNEEHDHPHHRSLWYAHGKVNGHDFWSEEKDFGRIVHDKFTEIKSGKSSGTIKSTDKWISAEIGRAHV